MGVVHERESYTSKPPALSENLPSFPSSSLSLLIVLHWLVACENSVGVQLNNLGSNVGPNWKMQVAFTFGLSIHSQVPFPTASPQRFHSMPALLDSMPRDWPHLAGRQALEWMTQPPPTWLSKGARAAQSTSSFSSVRFKWSPPQAWAWGLPTLHPCSSQESRQRDLGVSERELWWGEGGCSVSPKFEFLCFSWLVLNLKKEFSVWSKLVGEREHLCRKRCSWQACALFPSYYWRVECLNTVFLFASFPYGSVSPSVCFYNEVQS